MALLQVVAQILLENVVYLRIFSFLRIGSNYQRFFGDFIRIPKTHL